MSTTKQSAAAGAQPCCMRQAAWGKAEGWAIPTTQQLTPPLSLQGLVLLLLLEAACSVAIHCLLSRSNVGLGFLLEKAPLELSDLVSGVTGGGRLARHVQRALQPWLGDMRELASTPNVDVKELAPRGLANARINANTCIKART